MGSFKSFIESKGITAAQVATTSRRIEAYDETSRTLLVKRASKRRVKETADKKYAELNLAKPATAGRGISQQQVEAAIADKELSRKARAKILRAVNVILTKKNEAAADMKGLFEGLKARVGKKPQTAADKKS
jgi:hypothetical protein